jgi:hypothetical protein
MCCIAWRHGPGAAGMPETSIDVDNLFSVWYIQPMSREDVFGFVEYRVQRSVFNAPARPDMRLLTRRGFHRGGFGGGPQTAEQTIRQGFRALTRLAWRDFSGTFPSQAGTSPSQGGTSPSQGGTSPRLLRAKAGLHRATVAALPGSILARQGSRESDQLTLVTNPNAQGQV